MTNEKLRRGATLEDLNGMVVFVLPWNIPVGALIWDGALIWELQGAKRTPHGCELILVNYYVDGTKAEEKREYRELSTTVLLHGAFE